MSGALSPSLRPLSKDIDQTTAPLPHPHTQGLCQNRLFLHFHDFIYLSPFTFSIFLFYYISIYIFTIPILPQNYNHNFLLPQRFVARDFIFLFVVLSYANHIKHSKIRDCVMAGNGSSCFSC